jgi:hypothetical protein
MKKETEEITQEGLQKFFQDLNAFSWGFKQDVLNFLKLCTLKGYSPGYALKCIAIRQSAEVERVNLMTSLQDQWRKRAPKCPQCGKTMKLDPVNQGPGDQVGGKSKSMWRCPDWQGCGHDELSRKTVGEWLSKFGINLRLDNRPDEMMFELPEAVMKKLKEYPTYDD